MQIPSFFSSEESKKIGYGFGIGMVANVIAIPFSAIFANIACDFKMEHSFLSHYKNMGKKLLGGRIQEIYKGGAARTVQKVITSTANIFLPEEVTKERPYLSRLILGFGLGFITNPFKILQTRKIRYDDVRYPQEFYKLLFTPEGRQSCLNNSLIYSTNEAFRFVLCFAFSAELVKKLNPEKYKSPLSQFGICVVASSATALIESLAAFYLETLTVVHAEQSRKSPSPEPITLKEKYQALCNLIKNNQLHRHKYLWPCFLAVFIKNVFANIPITYGNYRYNQSVKKQSDKA